VNCLERLASRWEDVRSRRDLILAGGEGGKAKGEGEGVMELFTSGKSVLVLSRQRLGGVVEPEPEVKLTLPSSEGGGVITPEYRSNTDIFKNIYFLKIDFVYSVV
jgi:hypothetical protein